MRGHSIKLMFLVHTKIREEKNPHSQGLRGFKGGPTWTRTRDQMIMSHLL